MAGKKFTSFERDKIWRELKSIYTNGNPVNKNKYQYFDFMIGELMLRIDIYVYKKVAKKYGGNILISFDTTTFINSGIYSFNKTRRIDNKRKEKRVFFSNQFELENEKKWPLAVSWIRKTVAAIENLNDIVNMTRVKKCNRFNR